MKENHLSQESSPYLKQHVLNPVDWYPWGDEALSRAKNEDKPILVSIGYSTCHWCHVMERESFENEQIAHVMNANFVCIKVDREERPDVDQVYMDAVSAMGLRGGWPLNVFLTPDKKPFYGGTYFPPKGWMGLLKNIADVFHSKREDLEQSAQKYIDTLNKDSFQTDSDAFNIDSDIFIRIGEQLSQSFDTVNGGTAGAPKFPMPSIWSFIAQSISQNKHSDYFKQLFLTLDKMVLGGIYDQIGGGFSRYSTDEKWFAPHFEKMLYDNGQLLSLYAKVYRLEAKLHYKAAIYQTVDWLKREMLDGNGGFYAALDADSEGEEGKFYTWTYDELKSLLGEDYSLAKKYYNTTVDGNWEKDWNILHRNIDDEYFAADNTLELDDLKQKVKHINETLLAKRGGKIRPSLDDKILLGWNALMSSGLIASYHTFGEDEFLNLAQTNVDFMLEEMCKGNVLYHSYGKKVQGFMDDYALMIEVLVDLYQATFEEKYLTKADELTAYVLTTFYDKEANSFYYTSRHAERLVVDKKEMHDNVIPASNSIMAHNLLKLGLMLEQIHYTEVAQSMLANVHGLVMQQPQYMSKWASAFHFDFHTPYEVIIVGKEASQVKSELSKSNIPNHILMGTSATSNLSLLKDRIAIDGKTTIYVCQNKVCQLPVFTVEEALELMK